MGYSPPQASDISARLVGTGCFVPDHFIWQLSMQIALGGTVSLSGAEGRFVGFAVK